MKKESVKEERKEGSAAGEKKHWNKPVMVIRKPGDEADDVGLAVIGFIRSGLGVDEEWGEDTARGFSWWGHRLAQRVWADECRRDEGVDVTMVHIETDFLRDVGDSREVREGLNTLNAGAGLWAFIYYPEERRIRFHSAFYTHCQNVDWTQRLLMGAAGLQASYAHKKAKSCSCLFQGSKPDTSPHPQNGFRKDKDEMVLLLDSFLERSRWLPGIDGREFRIVEDSLPKLLASSSENGLTVEVPFSGDEPAILRMGRGLAPATALLQANTVKNYTLLGRGLVIRMTLPVSYGRDVGQQVAARLNLLETREFARCHMNGAWCVTENADVVFVSFLPVAFYQPGLLVNLVLSNALRSRWANGVLV